MPAWDKTRDYYGDLGLTPSASTDDIKRAYHKLALKCHPDRNPNDKEGATIKFQQIGAAFQILGDPASKRGYDNDRAVLRSRYPTASGVRGNPWQDVGKQYPAPPTRNQQPSAKTRASGASRYAGFANAAPPPRNNRPPSGDGAQSRQHYRAWENMRSQTRERPPPTPGRAPTSATRDARRDTKPAGATAPPPPRTASQREKAEASFGNTSRRPGYTPRSPGLGDEPPSSAKNYFTNRTHSNFFAGPTASTEPPEPESEPEPEPEQASAVPPDPLAQFRNSWIDDRHSTPYRTPGGEKTRLFDDNPGIGRSASTRTPPRRPEMPGAFPRHRARSSSPSKRSASNDGASQASMKVNTGDDDDYRATNGRPHAFNSPYSSRAGERYIPKSAPNTATTNTPPPHPASNGAETSYAANAQPPPPNSGPSLFRFSNRANTTRKEPPANIFTKNSTENINTSFVQGVQLEDWQFTAGGATADESSSPPKSRSRSTSRPIRRPVPRARQPSVNPMPTTQEADQEAFSKDGFSADDWEEKFGSHHFVPEPTSSTSVSPTRRATSRKAKPVKMTTGSAAIVDNDDGEGWQEIPRPSPNTAPAGTDSPSAMDIDTPPPEKADDTLKAAAQANGARKIPVEPTRPDWRPGNADAGPPKTTHATMNMNGSFSEKANAQPAQAPTIANPFAPQGGGSEDTEEFHANLSDLRKTEPFLDPTPTGLKSFADLKSTLPFESQPSEQIPLEKDRQASTLEFPHPPVGPRLPSGLVGHVNRPTFQQWKKYSQDFYSYMDKWEMFNGKVVEHFATRQKFFKGRRQQRGTAWLDGAPGSSGGVQEYVHELQQDQDVRKKWTDACDEHRERLREFMEFRERIK